MIAQIRADFEFRTQGLVNGEIACIEPYNEQPATALSFQLALLQSLRVMYYMDLGRTSYLPWTNLRLYDWMKSKVDGISFSSANSGFSCCSTQGGKIYINAPILNDAATLTFYRTLPGIVAGIAVLAHEARHRDGFGHTSCCPVGANACDQSYDEANLSPYGVQSWLYRSFLFGTINVGLYCSYANEIYDASFSMTAGLGGYQNRFCTNAPPPVALVRQLSEFPGGPCARRTLILPNGAITNAAGYANSSVIPGEIVTLFAAGVGPETPRLEVPITAEGTVDTVLGGARVLFNGQLSPMIYATHDQLSAIVPWTITGQPVLTGLATFAEVERNGQLSNILTIPYTTAGLQLFTTNLSGRGQAAALNADGSVNAADNPAARGSFVAVFGTGGGRTNPPQTTGAIVSTSEPFPKLSGVTAAVGGRAATISYAGAAPGAVAGLVQVNFQIPPDAPTGSAVPVSVRLGANANEVTIAIK